MEEFGQHFPTLTHDERRLSSCDPFIVEDLLDFSHDDGVGVMQDNNNSNNNNVAISTTTTFDHQNYGANSNNSTDSSTVVTPVDSCNSSFSGNNDTLFPPPTDVGSHFSGELGVPYDDLAHLEWLSNFVEESFSSEDSHKFHPFSTVSAMKTRSEEGSETRYYPCEPAHTIPTPTPTSPMFNREMPVPGKARSKRSRAAPCNWASRLLVLAPGSNEPMDSAHKPVNPIGTKKKVLGTGVIRPTLDSDNGGEVRKCLHCATDKTPQWRTGPMGPKTLCNACGVRYKSGRLVPEYRPASSPTFMLTKHSNSHRKVMELRRQKEVMRQQQLQPQQQYHQQFIHHHNPSNNNTMMFDPSNGDDYLIHQHIGPDFRQLI